jgi:plasmid stabilization system protein ParE
MIKKIVWSPSAENDFANILEYLNSQWNVTVANQFINLTEGLLTQISLNPMQFPIIHKTKGVRRCVLTKHNSVYYRVKKDQVEVLRIYDTRQHPDNLRF